VTQDNDHEQNPSETQLRRAHLGYGDGRDPLVKHPTLFPSEEAVLLGKRGAASAFAFFSSAHHPIIDPDTDWLETELAYVAEEYIRQARYAALPSSEEYRTYAVRVGRAVRALLAELEAEKEKSWGLDQGSRRELKLRLWSQPRPSRDSVEEVLRAFERVCDDFSAVKAPTALRPRDDIRVTAVRLARVWERLTGRRCPKNLEIDKIKGTRDFQAEGPRFVHAVAIVFDPSIELSQIATALRKRRAEKRHTQASPSDEVV